MAASVWRTCLHVSNPHYVDTICQTAYHLMVCFRINDEVHRFYRLSPPVRMMVPHIRDHPVFSPDKRSFFPPQNFSISYFIFNNSFYSYWPILRFLLRFCDGGNHGALLISVACRVEIRHSKTYKT